MNESLVKERENNCNDQGNILKLTNKQSLHVLGHKIWQMGMGALDEADNMSSSKIMKGPCVMGRRFHSSKFNENSPKENHLPFDKVTLDELE